MGIKQKPLTFGKFWFLSFEIETQNVFLVIYGHFCPKFDRFLSKNVLKKPPSKFLSSFLLQCRKE